MAMVARQTMRPKLTTGPTKGWAAVLASLWIAAGCVTTQDLDARLNSWVGKDTDQLVSAWGAPSGSYERKDGQHVLSYDRMGVITTGPGRFAQTYSRECRVDFVAGKDGKVASASWHGAPDQCDRSIEGYGGGGGHGQD